MYFIGNILSPTEGQPEAHDPTFAFTKKESLHLDMKDIPIRMEHDPNMQVGTIKRSWMQKDGSKWVLGKLNNTSFMERFANYAVQKDPLTNTTYYTGLSLQHEHIHRASGKTEKKAIEVSLCVDPRRDDCRIVMVKGVPNLKQTEKLTYKFNNINNKMEEQTKTSSETLQETVEQKKGNQLKMSPEEMMEVIIQLQKDKEATEEQNATELKELADLKAKIAKDEEAAFKKDQAKSMAMVRALTDQWAQELDQDSMSDAQKESIVELAKNYPRESMELLRVAHCASKKATKKIEHLNQLQKNTKQEVLTEKFEQVMQKRKPEVTVHAASTKKRKTDVQHFLTAMKQYHPSGSARDHMEQVSQIGMRKKRHTFY